MGIPPECQSIQDEIARVEDNIQQALQQLEASAPSQRPTVVQQLKVLTTSLHNLQDALGDCIVTSQQVEGLFAGTATIMMMNHQGTANVACSTLLNSARTEFRLTSFPPMSYPLGDMTLTVTKTSGGSGSYAGGRIVLPIDLHIVIGFKLGLPPVSADLSMTFSTDPPAGSPVSPEPLGDVTFVGSGALQAAGPPFDGQNCNMTIVGKISAAA